MGIDAAHLHLMLNHLPVIGAPIALVLLTVGLVRRSSELVTVALVLIIGLAAASALVYVTGEPAEELVEHAPWFPEALTERHEDSATVTLVATLVTAALAIAAFAFRRRSWGGRWLPRIVWGTLAASTLLLGWTAWSGGQIRHDEIRPTAGVPGPGT
jgi:hypothetical protein